jgi:hypothetical protein
VSRRCPNCGGLVGAGAQWCGQCLTRLDEPSAPPVRPSPPRGETGPDRTPPRRPADEGKGHPSPAGTAPPIRAGDQGIVWQCPSCDTANPIESTACRVCGTPFSRLFEEESTGPHVDSGRALALSLLFPGVGHLVLGRTAEGVARAVIFGYALAMVVSILVARVGRGVGPFLPLLLVSAVAGVGLYAVTAVDAGRIARGERPLLSTRALLYGAVGLMLLTVAVLVILGSQAGGQG